MRQTQKYSFPRANDKLKNTIRVVMSAMKLGDSLGEQEKCAPSDGSGHSGQTTGVQVPAPPSVWLCIPPLENRGQTPHFPTGGSTMPGEDGLIPGPSHRALSLTWRGPLQPGFPAHLPQARGPLAFTINVPEGRFEGTTMCGLHCLPLQGWGPAVPSSQPPFPRTYVMG